MSSFEEVTIYHTQAAPEKAGRGSSLTSRAGGTGASPTGPTASPRDHTKEITALIEILYAGPMAPHQDYLERRWVGLLGEVVDLTRWADGHFDYVYRCSCGQFFHDTCDAEIWNTTGKAQLVVEAMKNHQRTAHPSIAISEPPRAPKLIVTGKQEHR